MDDGQAIQNLIQQLNEAGDAAENTADDVGQIAENTKGAALMQAADQLSAVGDNIPVIGYRADAYSDTENAVTKVNAYFGETGKAAEQSASVIKNVYSCWCWGKHGCRGQCGSDGQKEPWRFERNGSDQPDPAGDHAGGTVRD